MTMSVDQVALRGSDIHSHCENEEDAELTIIAAEESLLYIIINISSAIITITDLSSSFVVTNTSWILLDMITPRKNPLFNI